MSTSENNILPEVLRKEFIRRTSYISEADRDMRAALVDEIARAVIEAERQRIAAIIESSWREGWAACRDSEYVGSEAEDSAYGDSEANRIALGLDQGESCGLEADRKRRGDPVAWINWETLLGMHKIPQMHMALNQVYLRCSQVDEEEVPLFLAPQRAEPGRGEPEEWQYLHGDRWMRTTDPEGHRKSGRKVRALYTAPQPADPDAATIADYEAALSDHRRLVRELDVLLNGEEGAAQQASLCDIVAQVRRDGIKAAEPVKVPSDADIDGVWRELTGRPCIPGSTAHAFAHALLARYGQPEKPAEEWQRLAAAVYQACGAYDMPVRILDALSAAANGEPFAHMIDSLLPVEQPAASEEPVGYVSKDSSRANMHVNLPEGSPLYAGPVAAQPAYPEPPSSD